MDARLVSFGVPTGSRVGVRVGRPLPDLGQLQVVQLTR
jgi:hypothetical protein